MKLIKKILIAILIISGLMPVIACIFAAFNQPMLMEMFHLTSASTPDLEKTIAILGAAMIPGALMQFLAAGWLLKGKEEGFTLTLWGSFMLISATLYMLIFFKLHNISDSSMFAVDFGKGILTLVLVLYARKK